MTQSQSSHTTTERQSQKKYTSVPHFATHTSKSSPRPKRIPAIDFTKGALVLIMVLYHWVNYFIGPQWKYYEYLRFLTPSFIFISGFIISNVYLSKYAAADPCLSRRLITRGIKLTAIFLLLNLSRLIIAPILGTDVVARDPFDAHNLFTIFVSGNLPTAGGKLISFSILLPISYLLMISGTLMFPYRVYRYTFHCVTLIVLLFILVLGLLGVRSYNLEFVAIGMLGILSGFSSIERINDLVQRPFMLALGYVCYTIAITIWNVPFVLLVVGVVLSLMIIYLVGITGGESNSIKSGTVLLGKYSLLGYIWQIAVLQMLSACLRRVNLGAGTLVISLFAAFAITMTGVQGVDRARARIVSVDRLYRAVFS